ncbi:MAG: bifunctional 5,10-methylenetetrahydrofolate dehydrogenase/5,10-methenyltetrahydrofolate cyclohydrolase [Clostridiales bacterium]|jgi:methylenetetrahydrofolate dehydrogenase (NADP+)/methenyltetrahydrofolate cyclohydrolase|nr:bifunctional 5,10-methylenetetrahydrofolate dehydrogenase/5,10-methenyltetrahydrofolate cyclohydrolase [Clostridiales bacterium]
MAVIIDGKAIAAKIKENVRAGVAALAARGIGVGLTVILVGNDAASEVYVNNKHRACLELGIKSEIIRYSADVSGEELSAKIKELNADPSVNGILVQLPLPKGLNEREILEIIDPDKDVDCFSAENVGFLAMGAPKLLPCTPAGIMELIASTGQPTAGKRAAVIGRSNIVGKPVFHLLLQADATVTVCHTKTVNLAEITREADIVVIAAGRAGLVTGDMIKPGAIVIDAGINRVNGKLCGDADFLSVSEKAGYITPVPGGVGPMTIAMLMRNALTAAENLNGRKI